MAAVVQSIERRFPGTRVLVEPFVSPDGGRDIHWLLYVVDVPAAWRYRIKDFADRKGSDLYGGFHRIPFLLSVHTRRDTPRAVSFWEEQMTRLREWRSARAAAGRRRRVREELRLARRYATRSPRRRGAGPRT
ncbi:MAG: hypothetical protein ACREIU_16225 [Planctomycetota bacterium]